MTSAAKPKQTAVLTIASMEGIDCEAQAGCAGRSKHAEQMKRLTFSEANMRSAPNGYAVPSAQYPT